MSVGITNYQWTGVDCPGPKKVMVVSQGNIFVGVCETTASSPATQTIFRKLFDKSSTGLSGGAIDPHFSPDGSKVAFVQDSELFVLPVDAGGGAIGAGVAPVQLTFGARAAGKTNGLADFIAQEEMDRYVEVHVYAQHPSVTPVGIAFGFSAFPFFFCRYDDFHHRSCCCC